MLPSTPAFKVVFLMKRIYHTCAVLSICFVSKKFERMIYFFRQSVSRLSSRKREGDIMDNYKWLMLALSLIQTVLMLLTFLK